MTERLKDGKIEEPAGPFEGVQSAEDTVYALGVGAAGLQREKILVQCGHDLAGLGQKRVEELTDVEVVTHVDLRVQH